MEPRFANETLFLLMRKQHFLLKRKQQLQRAGTGRRGTGQESSRALALVCRHPDSVEEERVGTALVRGLTAPALPRIQADLIFPTAVRPQFRERISQEVSHAAARVYIPGR
jgi:hypothetical protein